MHNEADPLKPDSRLRDDEAMAAILRAFQTRQVELLTDAEAWAAEFNDDAPAGIGADATPPAHAAEREALRLHLEEVAKSRPRVAWSEEWLYPVEVWSLICGLDAATWEEWWQNQVCGLPQPEQPDWPLLLQEFERLRSLKILPTNEEGKIRRDDAVKVAHTLGYSFDPGTPAYDILIHRFGVSPAALARPGAGFMPASQQPHPDLVRAVVAALVLFPALCRPEPCADLAAAILQTIRDRQILPPTFFGPDSDRGAIERQICALLRLVDQFRAVSPKS